MEIDLGEVPTDNLVQELTKRVEVQFEDITKKMVRQLVATKFSLKNSTQYALVVYL